MNHTLNPLDEKAAQVLAQRRGVTVDALISSLIREEAAIEITNWRTPAKADTPTPITAQNNPQAAQHDGHH